MNKVVLKNISKSYYNQKGTLDVIEDLSLEVKKGEVVVILGPSGCGKSTLLRCINGLEKIQAGDIIISINGKDIKNAKNFSQTIAESKINSEIVLRIWQNEQTKDVSLKIAKMPETKKEISNKDKKTLNKIPEGYISALGIIIKNEKDYVIIEEILADSDAKYKGVKSGDIIKKINDKNVNTVKDVKAYVDYALKADKDNIKLDILSNELPQSLKVSIINND